LIAACRLLEGLVTSRLAPTIVAHSLALSYDDWRERVRRRLRRGGVLVGEFGDKFRKEREKKGIPLEEVSNATKISSRMLRAIEDEEFDQLPGGVFNRGFIRAYAKHLGLDDDEAVAGYLACLRQSQLESQEVWDPQAQPGMPSRQGMKPPPPEDEELRELQLPRAEHVSSQRHIYGLRRESAFPWRILVLAVLVIILSVLLWRRHSHSPRTQAAGTPPATSTRQPAPEPANPSAQITTKASPTPLAASAPASRRQLTPKPPSDVSGTSSAHVVKTVSVKPVVPAEASSSNNRRDVDLATPSDQTGTPPTDLPTTTAAPLTLVIRASENSWISVTADGQSVRHELLIAPARTSVHAAREIVLKVGNAAGVTFLWNGQELPAQGAEAEVKTLVFDASGMRDATPDQAPPQNQ
jgi:cytoskeleton protein RodZ